MYTEEHGWEELSTTQDTNKPSPWPPSGPPSTGTRSSVRQENNKVLDKSGELVQLECCGAEIKAELRTNCEECGPPLEKRQEFSVLGSDVKALYPSITSENTGRIVREKFENSRVQREGFCWKKGLAYISMNKN